MNGRSVTFGVLLVGLFSAMATGQALRPPATIDDLLTEVQGLRADLVRTSSAGVRVQLLTARLAIQEQRLANLGNELATQQGKLAEIMATRREEEDRLKTYEKAASTNANLRADLEAMVPRQRETVARLQADEQQLRVALAGVSSQIAEDQGRWIDFSNRLDDLERSLPQTR
jgi:septal ring factor EnvC (AmiA/AmiB activator)